MITKEIKKIPQHKYKNMGYINLSVKDFKEKIETSDHAVLIDVRTPDEKTEGDISGSVLMNIMDADFPLKVEKLDKEKEYFLFCRSGGRSASACEYMNGVGFKTCYNLDGGINAWKAEFGS